MTVVTAIGINAGTPFNAGSTAPYWVQRKNALIAQQPQVIRTGSYSDKAVLDFAASIGATIWPAIDTALTLDQCRAIIERDHPANGRALSRKNEPWFNGQNGTSFAHESQPIYEKLRSIYGDQVWLSLPAIPDHSGDGSKFLEAMLKVWPELVHVVNSLDVHPYSNKTDPLATTNPGARWGYEYLRRVLDAAGGQAVVFDSTEQGNATAGTGANAYDVVSEATDAAWEDKLLAYQIGRGDCRSAMPYQSAETGNGSNEQEHFGHVRGDGSAKPVQAVFIRYAKQQRAAGATGVFAGHGAPPVPTPPAGGGTPAPAPASITAVPDPTNPGRALVGHLVGIDRVHVALMASKTDPSPHYPGRSVGGDLVAPFAGDPLPFASSDPTHQWVAFEPWLAGKPVGPWTTPIQLVVAPPDTHAPFEVRADAVQAALAAATGKPITVLSDHPGVDRTIQSDGTQAALSNLAP